MIFTNINCQRKEYRKVNGRWELFSSSNGVVDSYFISNMIDGGYYFTKLGGKQSVYYSSTRRFKNTVTKIVVDSICGATRCIYNFSYDNAKVCDNIDYLF